VSIIHPLTNTYHCEFVDLNVDCCGLVEDRRLIDEMMITGLILETDGKMRLGLANGDLRYLVMLSWREYMLSF
jgi:hypothetical protein